MKKADTPNMRLIHLAEDMQKFKPESAEVSETNIRSFVQSYLDGKLKVIKLFCKLIGNISE